MRLIAIILVLLLPGCANLRLSAHVATGVDAASTSIAVATGAGVEANPLLANPAVFAVAMLARVGLVEYTATLHEPDRTVNLGAINAVWWGVSISNMVILAATKVGMVAAFTNPIGLVIGAAAGWQVWQGMEARREFAVACAAWRLKNPDGVCEFDGAPA